jgi:predicted secreted Zn-dependent protease
MRRALARALLLRTAVCAAILSMHAAHAIAQAPREIEAPVIHDDIEYIDVTGNSRRDLIDALDRRSVDDGTGKRFYGHTRWELRWNFNVASDGGDCRVGSVSAQLDVHTSIPRWNPPANADPSLVRRWNAFVDALRVHEDGHRDIAIEAAREITQRIEAVQPTTKCETLKRTVTIRANTLLDEYREKGRRYDRETDHGRTQGAVLR